MAKLHCIVRPNRTGYPWGRAIIEAMSIGRPLLAAGHDDFFVKGGLTGWLFRPGDPAQLTQKLLKLICDPKCFREMGRSAFVFARDQFDLEVNARRIERILSETP